MRRRLNKGKIGMRGERFGACEMMIGWKEGDHRLRIHLLEARESIGDSWRRPVVVGLNEQARRKDVLYLIGVIMLMRPRKDQECLGPRYYPGNTAPGLLQKRFAADQSAELLWPVVAGDFPCQGKESLSIPTR